MPLQRNYFQLFAGGFSMCMILKQSVVVFSTTGETRNAVMLLVWLTYLFLQLAKVWSDLENTPISGGNYILYGTTFLYNLNVVGILVIGVDRYLAVNNTTRYYDKIKKGVYGIALAIFVARTVRSILMFAYDKGTTFPEASIIQLFTIFPIYTLVLAFDFLVIKSLWQIFQKTKLDNKQKRIQGFLKLGISVCIEFVLAIISVSIAILEAMSYKGNAPSFIDWWLISWITGFVIDQKQIIREILKRQDPVQGLEQKGRPMVIKNKAPPC